MGNNKITNLTDGTNAQDAVTYSQLVASTGGLSGRIVQIVQTIGTSSVTNSTAYVSTGHSASITPTSVSSKILVLNNASFAQTNLGGGNAFLAIYRNGSAISGGANNSTATGWSFVGGGRCNSAGSYYSAILGGQNNSTNNYDNAMIVGNGITADRVNATFVNNLSIKNIPNGSGGLPSGSVYRIGSALCIVP
jgi:hypothetical protein